MLQNKKENLCEFSVTGLKINDEKITNIIEELFENSPTLYRYEVTTYQLSYKSKDGLENLNNKIEIHQNLTDSYEK